MEGEGKMAFESMVYQIMIASPNDVENERNTIRETIYEWNTIHTHKNKIVLLPVGWETHSSPEMGNGPQEILNEQILKMSDLLIGVFWTRLGTPTEKAESGTVEEIREHIKAGKPAMLYFSSQPVQPDSIDPDQYAKLKEFKDECKKNGLYESYDSVADFQEKFRRQLTMKVFNHKYFDIQRTNEEKIGENPLSQVNLTEEANTLLVEAAKSRDGSILKVTVMEGLIIQVGNKHFGEMNNPRSEAIWKDALDLLLRYGLIGEVGRKGQVFKVTRSGYEYVDIGGPLT